MKLLRSSRVLKIILSSLLIVSYANANTTCAVVEFKSNDFEQINVEKINGEILYRGPKSYHKLKRSNLIRLPSGIHEFSGTIIQKNRLGNSEKAKLKYPIYFGLEIMPNMLYQISTVKNEDKVVDLKVSSQSNFDCNLEGEIFDARAYLPEVKDNRIELPENIALELQHVFLDLLAEYPSKKSSIKSIAPSGFHSDLGLTFSQYNKHDNGLEVLSVTPFSSASELGLLSGDIITEVNGKELNGDNIQKQQRITKAIFDVSRQIELRLIRNNKKYLLNESLKELFIPHFTYELNTPEKGQLIKYNPTSDIVRYQLEKVIASIAESFRHKFPKNESISFSIDKKADKRIGVIGIEKTLTNGRGVLVNFVESDSVATQLGIKVGDIILEINLEPHNDVNLLTTDKKSKRTYSVKLIRGESNLNILKEVDLYELPKVSMKISLQTENDYLASRKKRAAISRKINWRKNNVDGMKTQFNNNIYQVQSRAESIAVNTRNITINSGRGAVSKSPQKD